VEVTNAAGQTLASAPISSTDPANYPPVANPDSSTIRPGELVDGNVLDNDTDPDGDPLIAKVLEIAFASDEWSGFDPDGEFVYTAGPGTAEVMHKTSPTWRSTSKGAESQPGTAVVTIQPARAAAARNHKEGT
jgi:hypothetical protein